VRSLSSLLILVHYHTIAPDTVTIKLFPSHFAKAVIANVAPISTRHTAALVLVHFATTKESQRLEDCKKRRPKREKESEDGMAERLWF